MFGVGRVCFIVGISKTIRSIINIIRQSLWATNTVCGFVVCLGFPFAFKKQQQQQQLGAGCVDLVKSPMR